LSSLPAFQIDPKISQLSQLHLVYTENTGNNIMPFYRAELSATISIFEQIVNGLKSADQLYVNITDALYEIRCLLLVEDIKAESSVRISALIHQLDQMETPGLPISLRYLVDFIRAVLSKLPDTHLYLAKCAIHVCTRYVHLYTPQNPIDPASYAKIKLELVERKAECTTSDMDTAIQEEMVTSGNPGSQVSSFFEVMLGDLKKRSTVLASKLTLRPAVCEITNLNRDLKQLSLNILSDENLSMILESLLSPETRDSALEKSHALQSTISAFIARMSDRYSLYMDILKPLFLVLYHLKDAFEILECGLRNYSSAEREIFESCTRLVQFDRVAGLGSHVGRSIKSAEMSSSEKIRHNWEINLSLLYKFGATSCDRSLRGDVLEKSHSLFYSLIDIWTESEEKRKALEMEKEELYKYKEKSTILESEEEIEERELLASFPDFFAEFPEHVNALNVLNVEVPVVKSVEKDESSYLKLDAEVIHSIRMTHLAMMEKSRRPDFDQGWKFAYHQSFQSAFKLLQSVGFNVPSSGEDAYRLGMEFATDLSSEFLQDGLESPFQRHDFYRHANVAEAKGVISVLAKFDERLTEFLEQWPEHMQLLHLSALCQRIIKFPITSPIPKFMTGLEMILSQSENWEKYACKSASLKKEMELITNLIIHWRKLELQSWRQLLDLEDYQYYVKSSQLWVLIRTTNLNRHICIRSWLI
jgi:midasin (ATPase involved in ribosome maturation)